MKKLFLLIIVFGIGIFFFTTVFTKTKTQQTIPSVDTRQKTVTLTSPPIVTVIDDPVTLQIPKIGVTSSVEDVGMDSKGRMDIPKADMNVAWYKLGYKPGEKGNAVFAGHLDTSRGEPAVFYHLSSLAIGDDIIITGANGESKTFHVSRKVNYPYDDFPLQEVFGASTKPRVNLITCEGTWNASSHNYSHRTVVYAE